MGLEFQVDDDKVCYTPHKDKCEAIQNLDSPKTLKQTRDFLWHGQFPFFILPDLCTVLFLFCSLRCAYSWFLRLHRFI